MTNPIKKSVIIDVSTSLGVFIKSWSAFNFDGFTKELNGGVGEAIVRLPFPFDYAGADINLGNDVEIRIIDGDTLSGGGDANNSLIIYSGYISMVERDISEQNSEGIVIHLLGYYTKMSLDILKNGAQTTLYSYGSTGLTITSASQSAADVGLMMRAVIDRYKAENSGTKINYDTADIPLTSTTATYSFEQQMYRDAMDLLKKMAPAGTYYYVIKFEGSGSAKAGFILLQR